MSVKEALKQYVPTAPGVCGLGKVKVELFPFGVDVPVEPMPVPPVQEAGRSWQSVQPTVPGVARRPSCRARWPYRPRCCRPRCRPARGSS